jgi:hypothetical protein
LSPRLSGASGMLPLWNDTSASCPPPMARRVAAVACLKESARFFRLLAGEAEGRRRRIFWRVLCCVSHEPALLRCGYYAVRAGSGLLLKQRW